MTARHRIDARTARDRSAQAACRLAAMGAGTGDRVGVVAGPSLDLLVVTYGALRAGIIPVLLNPGLLPAEQAELLADADPRLVLRDADVRALAQDVDAPRASIDLADVPLGRPMLYTSGTTGRPKGVWSGVLSEAEATAAVADESELWGFRPDDVNLAVSPLYHSAPMRFALGTLLAGGEVVVPGRFDPQVIAASITEHRVTTAFMAPPHVQRLLALDVPPPLASFRLLAHAGAPCPEPLKWQMIEAFGADVVWEFYGSTEGQFTACPAADWIARPATVGRARPGRSISVDDDGIVWCTPPTHSRFEYWRDPARTAAAWRDGAFTVCDLGRIDDAGFLYLDGRRDDLVISGGVNVYPVEVERALQGCRGVEDVVVFGVPDERWGQMVVAAVVGSATPASLDEFARANLAAWKRPKRWIAVEEIAVSATGKVQRSHLASELGLA